MIIYEENTTEGIKCDSCRRVIEIGEVVVYDIDYFCLICFKRLSAITNSTT